MDKNRIEKFSYSSEDRVELLENNTNTKLFDYEFNDIIYIPETVLYDIDGNLVMPTDFQPPINGIANLYNKDGLEQISIPYKNGYITGTSTIYHDNTKVISSISNYKENKLDGECMSFSENGHIASKETFKNGIKEGLQELFYDNEQLKAKSNFVNNIETVQEVYLEDGTNLIKDFNYWLNDFYEPEYDCFIVDNFLNWHSSILCAALEKLEKGLHIKNPSDIEKAANDFFNMFRLEKFVETKQLFESMFEPLNDGY